MIGKLDDLFLISVITIEIKKDSIVKYVFRNYHYYLDCSTLWESDNMICLFDLDNCINVYLARIYLQKKGIHDNNSRQVRN